MVVDAGRLRDDGLWHVERCVLAALQHESMRKKFCVDEHAHDLTGVVNSVGLGKCRALRTGNISELITLKHKPHSMATRINVGANDRNSLRTYVFEVGVGAFWVIDLGHGFAIQGETVECPTRI